MASNITNFVPDEYPTGTKELRINGLSLLFFDYYKSSPGVKLGPPAALKISPHDDYLIHLDVDPAESQNQSMYECPPLAIPPVQLPQAGSASGAGRLLFRIFDDSFVVAVTVINVDLERDTVHDVPTPILKKTKPRLDVDRALLAADVLKLISELNEVHSTRFETLRQLRQQYLDTAFGPGKLVHHGMTRSRKNVGIQIWSIANLAAAILSGSNARPPTLQDGKVLSETYGWEIAALMDCGSDLMLKDRNARTTRHQEQIIALLEKGTEILSDHRVLIQRSVCLEISQINSPTLRPRSENRLYDYGFDSTSLYLWCILAAQEAVLLSFNDQMSEALRRVQQLLESPTTTEVRSELKNLISVKVGWYRALDGVVWLSSRMREERHVRFFKQAEKSWGLDSMLSEVNQKLRAYTETLAEIQRLIDLTTRIPAPPEGV
jgi:hypothetical protein